MKKTAIGDLYDGLLRFESFFKNRFDYPIHKKLDFGSSEDDSIKDVSDLIYKKVKPRIDDSSLLDIGCGTGYMLLKFAHKHQFHGLGISLSRKEIKKAKKSALKQGIQSVEFKIHDFHKPLDRIFDIVMAIESLKHAGDPYQVARVVYQSTLKNSILCILDDFSLKHHEPKHEKQLKHYWSLNHLYSEKEFLDSFAGAGFDLTERVDLTPFVAVPSLSTLDKRMKALRMIRSTLPEKSFLQRGVEAFLGGTLLDRMYATGTMHYVMLMFHRS